MPNVDSKGGKTVPRPFVKKRSARSCTLSSAPVQHPDGYQGRQDHSNFMPETTFPVKLPVLQHIRMAYSTRFSVHDIDRAQLHFRPRQVAFVALIFKSFYSKS